MVPRWNLGPRMCCSHTLVSLGARWYLGMCECDSTTPFLSRNPYNYPSPLSLNYLEESPHMSIASWLIRQESTQLMNNLEQECREKKIQFDNLSFDPVFSPLFCSMRKTPHQFLCQNPIV